MAEEPLPQSDPRKGKFASQLTAIFSPPLRSLYLQDGLIEDAYPRKPSVKSFPQLINIATGRRRRGGRNPIFLFQPVEVSQVDTRARATAGGGGVTQLPRFLPGAAPELQHFLASASFFGRIPSRSHIKYPTPASTPD